MGSNFSLLPILVNVEHNIHVGHDRSLHRLSAAETAGNHRARCSRTARAWVALRGLLPRFIGLVTSLPDACAEPWTISRMLRFRRRSMLQMRALDKSVHLPYESPPESQHARNGPRFDTSIKQ